MVRKIYKLVFTCFFFIYPTPFLLHAQKGLSKPTKDIINNIKTTIDVKVYISSELPDSMKKTESLLKSLLKDYEKESDGKIVATFIDAEKINRTEFLFLYENFKPFGITVELKNLYKHVTVFSGAVIYYGTDYKIIPALTPNMPLEYIFSKAIKNVTTTDKKNIGVITGQGEPQFSSFEKINKKHLDLYHFEPVNLQDVKKLEKFDALAWISPKEIIDDKAFKKVDDYLERGGNIFLAVDRVRYDYYMKKGIILLTRMGQWLSEKGIDITSKFVADENCGIYTLSRDNFEMPVALPYLPKVSEFELHPVTRDLNNVVLNYPSFLNISTDLPGVQILMKSSVQSEIYSSPLEIDYNKMWQNSDFSKSELIFSVAFKKNLKRGKQSKIIVVSDGDFLLDENREYKEKADNLSFLFNSIEWLTDDNGLEELKIKRID